MAPSEKKEKEKLPVHPNLSEIQARIDIALAKRAAIVDSWVCKYDTSRCAPDKTQEELKAWDEELYNPPPPNLGLGAEIPKEYLDGEGNRMMNAGNGKLRTLMLGGQKIGKKRDEREKEESRKRAKAESSDEEEGRASLVKSKKAKHKKSEEEEKEKPVKIEKVNKALLAMQKQEREEEEEEEEKRRGEDNPWKNAPKPLSSLAKKKEKKKSKHAELLTELASTNVLQKTPTTTVVTPAASTPKKESPLPIRTINPPTSSSAPPSLGTPLNAAALALSVSASDTASTSTPSIASSGSPSRSIGVELTEEERKRKERLKEKKRKQKEAKKKKKAEALAAAKAVGGDAEMKDA